MNLNFGPQLCSFYLWFQIGLSHDTDTYYQNIKFTLKVKQDFVNYTHKPYYTGQNNALKFYSPILKLKYQEKMYYVLYENISVSKISPLSAKCEIWLPNSTHWVQSISTQLGRSEQNIANAHQNVPDKLAHLLHSIVKLRQGFVLLPL